ncbi:hypothetical protein [Mucilaginibacter sp.]
MIVDLGNAPVTPASIAAAIAAAKLQAVDDYLIAHPPIQILSTFTVANSTDSDIILRCNYMPGNFFVPDVVLSRNNSKTFSNAFFDTPGVNGLKIQMSTSRTWLLSTYSRVLLSPDGDGHIYKADPTNAHDFIPVFNLGDLPVTNPTEVVIVITNV